MVCIVPWYTRKALKNFQISKEEKRKDKTPLNKDNNLIQPSF